MRSEKNKEHSREIGQNGRGKDQSDFLGAEDCVCGPSLRKMLAVTKLQVKGSLFLSGDGKEGDQCDLSFLAMEQCTKSL